jgi:hypothetical protein
MKIMVSDICHAFNPSAVGSKIKFGFHDLFMQELEKAINKHKFMNDKYQGQSIVELPAVVNEWVSPGSWVRSKEPNDYVIWEYRGEVGMYLKRRNHMTSAKVRCVVYTKTAYENDPDYTADEAEMVKEFFGLHDGYVLVAVLGDCDTNPSTVSYSRFVKNLAGANNEYKVMSKDEVVALAQKVDEYRKKYSGVAD